MKNIQFVLAFFIVGVFFASCEEYTNTAEESSTTFLPKLTMNGATYVELTCDAASFADEGIIAEEAGTQIDVTTNVAALYFGSAAVDGSDLYNIFYSAYNKDSIPGAAIRTVLWPECNGDFVSSIAGMYTVTVVRNGSAGPDYTDNGPFIVKDMGDGVYQLSDGIGSYYDFGRGYGPDYACLGMQVKANDIASNDFSFLSEGTLPWGGVVAFTGFSVDAAAKTISYSTEWDLGYVFEVTLTQVQ